MPVRGQLGLRLGLGGGSPSRSVLASVSKLPVLVRYAAITNKKLGGAACRASCKWGLRNHKI